MKRAPTFDLARAVDLIKLRKLVQRLPEGQRQVTELRLKDFMASPEVAYICRITVGTVKSQEYRSRQKLRKWMTEGAA